MAWGQLHYNGYLLKKPENYNMFVCVFYILYILILFIYILFQLFVSWSFIFIQRSIT